MDEHAATRGCLRRLAAESIVVHQRMHPHTFVTTMLDAGPDLRYVQIAARHAYPRTAVRCDRARTTSTATPTTPSPPTWPPAPNSLLWLPSVSSSR
jgi:hypothetical protein